MDPFTPVIGNPEILKCFLELIEIDPKTFNYQSASVEREAEKIDLLIYDEKSAIIIENKINFACDQPNQFPRYYEKIKNKDVFIDDELSIYHKQERTKNTNSPQS